MDPFIFIQTTYDAESRDNNHVILANEWVNYLANPVHLQESGLRIVFQ